jgi:hypothetical protein
MAEATENPPEDLAGYARAWVEAWEQESANEKEWRDSAKEATDAYKGKGATSSFNIYHSNVETLVPALYNSTPQPDVRRRFQDDDHVGKEVGDLLERALSFSVDAYDYDDVMDRAVRDMALVSRGMARLRYVPLFKGEGEEERKVYEEIVCEHVTWESFRRGPAKVWSQVPWVGFEHFLDRREVERLHRLGGGNVKDLKEVSFTYSADSKSHEDAAQRETPRFGGRARVLEIWDKDAREVIWILPSDGMSGQVLARIEDPMELEQFFPIPRPMQTVTLTDSLIPVTAYSIYQDLITELAEVSERIKKLIKQLRPRGGYAGVGSDVKDISEADDGELVPIQGAEMFASQGGGIDKAITWFPLEPTILALKQLYEQREAIKQTIYEVTGLSDILRGATAASETATAQQIKTQWGSVRIQKQQSEVQRFARDLFRLKAEIIASTFDMETLTKITGLRYMTQAEKAQAQQQIAQAQQMAAQAQQVQQAIEAGEADPNDPQVQQMLQAAQQIPPEVPPDVAAMLEKPSIEEIEEVLRDDAVRSYRIDIESDSTIRGDLTRNQEAMKGFLEGTAAYGTAMGPLVMQGAMPKDVAVEIFGAFARHFKLGKQAEDAIDRWADSSRKEAEQQAGNPQEAAAAAAQQAAAKEQELKDRETAVKEGIAAKEAEEKDRRFALDKEKQDFELSRAQIEDARADRQENRLDRDDMRKDRDDGRKQELHGVDLDGRRRDINLRERTQDQGHSLARDQLADSQMARREAAEAALAEQALASQETELEAA